MSAIFQVHDQNNSTSSPACKNAAFFYVVSSLNTKFFQIWPSCAFSQSEWRKYFEWILICFISWHSKYFILVLNFIFCLFVCLFFNTLQQIERQWCELRKYTFKLRFDHHSGNCNLSNCKFTRKKMRDLNDT